MKKKLIIALYILCTTISCAQKKPNIVLIFTDDQTYSSIHALGNKEIITPNMDKMVKEGTTFTHAYNMGSWSGAVCAASRAMMISGRFVWRANEFRSNWSGNDPKSLDKSWSKILESGGYETYMTGKWHVDASAKKIFNHVLHERHGMPKDAWTGKKMNAKFKADPSLKVSGSGKIMPIGYNRPQNENDTLWSPSNPKHGGFWEGGKHWSEVLKDDAINFIDKAKKKERSFFYVFSI